MTKFNYKFNSIKISNSGIFSFHTWLLKKGEDGLINGLTPRSTYRTSVTECTKEWHKIDWKQAGAEIKGLQEEIVKATHHGKMKEVYRLQGILIQKHGASALAIRKVITNKRGKAAGVDGVV